MNKLQIFYPDPLLVKQILDWVLPVSETHIDLYEDDDMARIDIESKHIFEIKVYSEHVTIFIGPAIIIMKKEQYGSFTVL